MTLSYTVLKLSMINNMNQATISIPLSNKKINIILFVLIAFFPLVGMGIDLLAPSLPAISASLHVPASFSKNLITLFMLGVAIASLAVGFLSDAWGRRKIMLAGMIGYTVASLLPPLMPFPAVLLIARFLQGISIASYPVLARGVMSDILSAEQLKRISVLFAVAWGIGPVIGPVIGGYLQYYFDWQACFYFFAIFSFVTLLAMLAVVPETHFNRKALNVKTIKDNFIEIISHRAFLGSILFMGFSYSFLIVFNTLGPFIIQEEFAKTPIYFGHLALFMGVCFLVGTLICHLLIKSYSPEKIIKRCLPAFVIIIIICVGLAYFDRTSLSLIIIASIVMYLACGIMYPAASANALAVFRHLAGSAASTMSFINISITTITAFSMSLLNVRTAVFLCFLYLIFLLVCSVLYRSLIQTK